MSIPAVISRRSLTRAQWAVLILLALSVFINYIDRGNLGIAAPLLQTEFNISNAQLGKLLSSFFWTYALFQIVSGWAVDRFNVNWVIAGGFFLWSAATAVTGMVHGLTMLFALRLVLGMGESVAYPSYSKILAEHVPEHHRGLANALIDAGSKCGPAVGTLIGGVLMAQFGWRPFFVVLGLGSLLWLLPWMIFMPREPGFAARTRCAPSILEILKQRSAWGTFGGLFGTNYFWYFLLTWLPSYLVRERIARGFTEAQAMRGMAMTGAAAYFAIGVATTISGWISDRWIERGGDVTRVRKTFAAIGLSGSCFILPVCLVSDPTLEVVLLMLACISFGIYTCSLWSITQTLAGPNAAGKWTGVQNCIGNTAGWVAPWLTGVVLDQTHQFFWAFMIAAAMAFFAMMCFVFVVGRVEECAWRGE